MKIPPFVLGLAILLWGSRMGFLLWVLPFAVAVEAAHWVKARWEMSLNDMNRIWDLCTLLVLGESVILISARDRLWGQVSFQFFQWLPLPLFPIMLAQAFGSLERIPMSVFWLFLRRKPQNPLARRKINIAPFYFLVCLTGASVVSRDSYFFYPQVVILILLALAPFRPRRIGVFWWGILVLVAFASGFAMQGGLRAAQSTLEASMVRWIATFFRRDSEDLRESRTAIGKSGTIRLSGRIVYRVKPEDASPPPELIREASFDSYERGVWYATKNELGSTSLDTNDSVYLLPPRRVYYTARISRYLHRGTGLLAVPLGTFELHDLPVISLLTNRLGVLKVDEGPGFVNYKALYSVGPSMDSPQNVMDTKIPESESLTVHEIVNSLNLGGKTDKEKLAIIEQYFQQNFRYTLQLQVRNLENSGHRTALGQFLTETKAGHCEYFATATVLILRAAGIPARYATGYAVHELGGNGTYVVRERDGHAWVLVYRKDLGRWDDLDTTPAGWGEVDGAKQGGWESISDFFSRLVYEFNRWRESKTSYTKYLSWALGVLILFLGWRLVFARRRKRISGSKNVRVYHWPGLDSEYPQIERDLNEAGLGRMPGEVFDAWVGRVSLPELDNLRRLHQLHCRLRFDPEGLNETERQELRTGVQTWRKLFNTKLKLH